VDVVKVCTNRGLGVLVNLSGKPHFQHTSLISRDFLKSAICLVNSTLYSLRIRIFSSRRSNCFLFWYAPDLMRSCVIAHWSEHVNRPPVQVKCCLQAVHCLIVGIPNPPFFCSLLLKRSDFRIVRIYIE
jgi:hypothetical protein